MIIFFYGLFMDESLLVTKGIKPNHRGIGHLDEYELRIGHRATLMKKPDQHVYGILMEIQSAEVQALYAEESVADYEPENVRVTNSEGQNIDAICYNLPVEKITGSNKAYAVKLQQLAKSLNFPVEYLDQIRRYTQS